MSKPKSRAARFSEALDLVSQAKSDIEDLRDELQNWRDGMPENLQASSKAEELDNAIGELETVIGDLENAEGASVFEHAAKCRVARLGIPHSDEIKKKIGDWSRGKKKSPATIERMKQAWKKRNLERILNEF